MDVVNVVVNISQSFGSLLGLTWLGQLLSYMKESYEPLHVIVIITLILGIITSTIYVRRWKKKALSAKQSLEASASRFRKRDKALFYGRKMLRKVRSISGQVRSSGQGRKRRMVMRFARRILQLKKENESEQLKVLEPPAEYMQEDLLADDRMPPDALYMLQSIRVFGHFEKPVFLKLCKHTEIINLHAGAPLFKLGDPDESIYIVQSGKINVHITGQEGSCLSLKTVKTGESVTSLLSFIETLSGAPSIYRTVSAKAAVDSTIVKLPMSAFQEIFSAYPETFIRVVQVIMIRLLRVTFTALHQYLGLSSELVNPGPKSKKNSVAHFHSPVKVKSNETYDTSTGSQPINVPNTRRPKTSVTQAPDLVTDGEVTSLASQSYRKRSSIPEEVDEESLIKYATEALATEMGLDDPSLLEGLVRIRDVPAGTYLMKEESNEDLAIIYILSGVISVSQKLTDVEEEVHMFTAYHGDVLGGLAVLTGEPSIFTVRTKHTCRLAFIPINSFYGLMKEKPSIVLYIAKTVVKRLSPFVRQVDFALDWVFLESGRAVYRQEDDSDCTYVVLSGRLRSVITHKNGKKEVVAEYGKGDLVGIVEMVTHTQRSTTVIAVRDSELAKLPEGLFNAIKLKYPIVVTRLITLLGHRILGTWQNTRYNNQRIESRPAQSNFSTVAIVPVSDDVPLTAFTYELYHCLNAIGSTLRLTSDVIRKTLGSTIMDVNNDYFLTSWLGQQEDQNKICLYQCDFSYTAWTQRCVRQADCILIVGLGDSAPTLGKVEKEIERMAMRTQKELVLLHREGSGPPKNTVAWLNMRSWISSHHHILCPKRMFSRKSLYRINELYSKVCMSQPNIHSDFSRLARWLTGTSVGLVLGGGGAKGSAHVGMIKAIQEAGIPIDMVGGVSIGAFMGALWCQERNVTTLTQKAREWSKKMTQWWRQIFDLTYPMTSMFSGRDFNQTIKSTFGETYIEDLWLPYFTITTDITSSCMRIHTHGSLWRYIRSSMSLSGYMPPLCDPVDGHLLLDGGYTNNLPADVMRSQGAHHIIAIDVGSEDDQDLTNYGDDLSGWWLLWKRWNPFTSPIKVPNLPDIQSRLAYVSCVRQLEEVKNSDYCQYIRPPIDKYRTLQFGSFDEIREVGYQHGKTYFQGQLNAKSLVFLKNTQSLHKNTESQRASYTFTDLAQMVCQVQRPYDDLSSTSESLDEDDFEDGQGYASEPSAGILDQKEHDLIRLRRAGGSLSLSENEMETELDFNIKRKLKEV